MRLKMEQASVAGLGTWSKFGKTKSPVNKFQ